MPLSGIVQVGGGGKVPDPLEHLSHGARHLVVSEKGSRGTPRTAAFRVLRRPHRLQGDTSLGLDGGSCPGKKGAAAPPSIIHLIRTRPVLLVDGAVVESESEDVERRAHQ
eukprot:2854290-Pyramimonas_sp.AAC.1